MGGRRRASASPEPTPPAHPESTPPSSLASPGSESAQRRTSASRSLRRKKPGFSGSEKIVVPELAQSVPAGHARQQSGAHSSSAKNPGLHSHAPPIVLRTARAFSGQSRHTSTPSSVASFKHSCRSSDVPAPHIAFASSTGGGAAGGGGEASGMRGGARGGGGDGALRVSVVLSLSASTSVERK